MSSDLELPDFRNAHRGEVGVVIANGPSLAAVPEDWLERNIKVACNHYGCACDHSAAWPRAEYWSQLGADQIATPEQREHYYPAIEAAEWAFVNRNRADWFTQDNVLGILSRQNAVNQAHKAAFSFEPLMYVGIGFTQTYISLQLAHYLGFDTVLIVGLDNDYTADPEKAHYYPDASHNFTPTLHGNPAFMEGSNQMFALAREAFERAGRKVLNLTPNSKAYAFESDSLENWF